MEIMEGAVERVHMRQRTDYYCGPAVIQMALRLRRIRITQKEAARLARTNKKVGTRPQSLVAVLRSYGLRVRGGNNRTLAEVRAALKRGEAVIVCYTERHWGWGHYSLVRSADLARVELIDPAESARVSAMTTMEFRRRWKDPLFTKTVRWAAFVGNFKKKRS